MQLYLPNLQGTHRTRWNIFRRNGNNVEIESRIASGEATVEAGQLLSEWPGMTEHERNDLIFALQSVPSWPKSLDPVLRVLLDLVIRTQVYDLAAMFAATADVNLKADYLRKIVSGDFLEDLDFAEAIGWAKNIEPIADVADKARCAVDELCADAITQNSDSGRTRTTNALAAIDFLHSWQRRESCDQGFIRRAMESTDPVVSESALMLLRKLYPG